MQHIEDNEQITLFRWAQFQSGKYPELDLMFHVPNGGRRDKREAVRFKAMGVKPGVSDIFLPVAQGGYHGLFIEMKAPDGRASAEQKKFINAVREQGYRAEVCFGWEQASKIILDYIGGKYDNQENR